MKEHKFKYSTDDNVSIAGTYYPSQGAAQRLAVLFHGFSSGQANSTNKALLPPLHDLHFGILCFDFRGCGLSEGELGKTTISSGIKDLKAALDGLIKLDSTAMSDGALFIGSSFGGAVAMAAAFLYNPGFIALKSPMLNIAGAQKMRRGYTGMAEWEKNGFVNIESKAGITKLTYDYISDSQKYDFYNTKFNNLSIPVSIVHGTDDEIAPIIFSEEFVEKNSKYRKLIRIEGANHHYREGNQFELMIEAIMKEVNIIAKS